MVHVFVGLEKGIKFSNQFSPFDNLGIGVVLQVLDSKVFFKSWSIFNVSQALYRKTNTQTPILELIPVKPLQWCCCEPEAGSYSGPAGPACPVLCYSHQSPLITSRSLSSLILKLNRFLVAKLLPLFPPPVISEKVVKEKSSFKLEFICGLLVLFYSLSAQIVLLLPLCLPSSVLSPCVQFTGSKFSRSFSRLQEPYLYASLSGHLSTAHVILRARLLISCLSNKSFPSWGARPRNGV